MESYTLKEIKEKGLYDEAKSFLKAKYFEQIKNELLNKTLKQICRSKRYKDAKLILHAEVLQIKNEFYTPREAFEQINHLIQKNKVIWEPFTMGNHECIKSPTFLRELGHKVVATGENFFTCNYGDIVVSNIPFSTPKGVPSIKKQILKRLVFLNKPFIVLVPISFLQTIEIKVFQQKYGDLQLIIPCNRIKFYYYRNQVRHQYEHPNNHHMCCWICWGMNYERDVYFL